MVRYQPQTGLILTKLPSAPWTKVTQILFSVPLSSELVVCIQIRFVFFFLNQYCSSVFMQTKTYIESWLCWQCNTQRCSVQNAGECKGEKRNQFSIWETRSEEEKRITCSAGITTLSSSPLALYNHAKIDYLGHSLMTCECHVYHSLSKCTSDKILPIKFN